MYLYRDTHDDVVFFFNTPSPTEIYTLSLHDALPILDKADGGQILVGESVFERLQQRQRYMDNFKGFSDEDKHGKTFRLRSEEHTSELQSLTNLVCRLLLEKKKQQT